MPTWVETVNFRVDNDPFLAQAFKSASSNSAAPSLGISKANFGQRGVLARSANNNPGIKLEIRPMDPQSRENQLRLAAQRLGLRLEKSRAHDPDDETFGGYMLVYSERNAVAYGAAGHKGRGYSLTLDGVEAYLKRREKQEKRMRRNLDMALFSGR